MVDDSEQAATTGARSTPYFGWEDGDEEHRVWIQCAIGGADWASDQEHLRQSYRVGQIAEVAKAPHLHTPIDLVDEFDVYLVAEVAETTLDRVLRAGPLPREDVEILKHRLASALSVLHGVGLVHSDVREDNVLRINGEWRLGDLGGVVEHGKPIVALQKDAEYVRPGAALREPANPANDWDALGVVVAHATRGLGSNGHRRA